MDQMKKSTLTWDKQHQTLTFQYDYYFLINHLLRSLSKEPRYHVKAKVDDALTKLLGHNPEEPLTLRSLSQIQPKYEEINLGDIKEFDKKTFLAFE